MMDGVMPMTLLLALNLLVLEVDNLEFSIMIKQNFCFLQVSNTYINIEQLPPNPPFQIAVCWKYDKIFRETQKLSESKSITLAIYKPKINNVTKQQNEEKKNDPNDEEKDESEQTQEYILGYLGLNHGTDPNDNIPILLVKEGSDKDALRAPKNFELIHHEKARRKSPKSNKDMDVYRYWLKIIPEEGYVAMGSVVIEKYREPIDENVFDSLKEYFHSTQQRKYLQLYALDKLMTIKKKYADEFGQPLVEKLLTHKKAQFILHRPQSLVISGVYKLVEMPCVIRKLATFTMAESPDNNVKMEHYTANITPKILDLCVQLLQHNIRIVVDTPLIISYATRFELAWSSKKITTTSNTKAAVWKPVLGPDEFMVGHVAYGDWLHPASHNNNCKLLIIKSGGSDPDAFKEPLGFECIWSLYRPGDKHQLGKGKGVGSGLLLSKMGSSVGLVDDEAPPSASFWRAIPPQGYTALGDIAITGKDGIPAQNNQDGSKKKIGINQLLRSHDVPKYVCIKNEYLSSFRTLEVDDITGGARQAKGNNNIFDDAKGNLQSSVLENKVRNRIWSSERCKDLKYHAGIYEQEPVTRDILSPMLCKGGKKKPESHELYPTLDIEHVIEAQPFWNVVKAGVLKKKGEGFYAQSHKRYFVLTNDKLIRYYDECKFLKSIDLKKMKRCGNSGGSEREFWIQTPERKWELEVVDDNVTATEWVQAIRYVKARQNIGGPDDEEDFDEEFSTTVSPSKSSGIIIEEKESEQEKIVKLLTKMLKKFEELLKHTKEENETAESVQNAVKWYEDLENTQAAIDILLAKWPRGTVCPPGVVRARAQLKDLMEQSASVILDDIKAYSNENVSTFTVLRLHKACSFMSDLNKGQMMVSQYISDVLLRNSETVFTAGNKDSDLAHIDRRFNEYKRQMKEYDKKFMPFIPKWWNLPIQIASRFCSIMGETLDDQLTRFPESHDSISEAKKKCGAFEQELIDDAMRRMAMTEVDARSWGGWDKGDPVSYIKIDDEDVMIKGIGLCVVVVDLFTRKVLKKKLFPLYKYSAWKSKEKHKRVLQEWLQYLNDVDDHSLIIMASHNFAGQQEFKKQLGVTGLPQQLIKLNLTDKDMYNETNLFPGKGSFIFIGRKGRKDSYFTYLHQDKREGPVMARQIIAPFIPKNRLKKVVDVQSIPFYQGIISQVLERHLDIFVGEEAKNVQKILASVHNEENMVKLEETKNWLSTINKLSATQKSNSHFDSILKVDKTIKSSIEACMKISNGKPLLDLLRKHAKMLQDYASIILKLVNQAGGDKLRNKLNTHDNKSANDDALLSKLGDEEKKSDQKSHSTSEHVNKNVNVLKTFIKKEVLNMDATNANIWSDQQIQFFVIYCCMVYNTCGKARDLLNDLIKIGKTDMQQKYKGGATNDLTETRDLYLSVEEQCLQLVRAAVIDKFESIFQFEKHKDWKLENYKNELNSSFDTYLSNPSKLLPPAALEHWYKVFCAHFALRLFDRILHSNTLNSTDQENSAGSVLIDFPPIFESVVLKKMGTQSRVIKKMQIYVSRCMNPVIKLIQLAYANAGDKYTKLESIKSENDGSKNLFSKFFGGGNKKKVKDNAEVQSIDTSMQMKTRQKTAIANTTFATKSVEFYIDNTISLHILKNVPSYKELFADDDDFILTNNTAAEAVANAIDKSLETLDDVKRDFNANNKINNMDNDQDSDSPLPDLDAPSIPTNDSDYFGNEPQPQPQPKGFAVKTVKKKKKKKKKMAFIAPPSAAPPKAPGDTNTTSFTSTKSGPPTMAPPSAPQKEESKAHIGLGIGLSAMSLIVKTELKNQRKWNVIERIMALRGFDVSDQQTIRILCEDAQSNIEATK